MEITVKNFSITDEDIRLINQFTTREFTGDELYTFSVILCDNDIDRDLERFDIGSLNSIAKLFIGKTGIFDHNVTSKGQSARIYSTEIFTDDSKLTQLNEPYVCVKAKAYMVKNEKNKELMLEIDGGIKKEISVSCSIKSCACSICKTDTKQASCSHKKGKEYGNVMCHHILSGVTDAYEWSFVAVPAQKNAGVTKEFSERKIKNMQFRDTNALIKAFKSCDENGITVTMDEAKLLIENISLLEKSAHLGEIYRNELISEVKKLSFLVNQNIPCDVINSVTSKMDIDELKAFKKAYECTLDDNVTVQLGNTDSIIKNTADFKI